MKVSVYGAKEGRLFFENVLLKSPCIVDNTTKASISILFILDMGKDSEAYRDVVAHWHETVFCVRFTVSQERVGFIVLDLF